MWKNIRPMAVEVSMPWSSTPNGKLIFHIMAALAEWEAAMIRERTLEGLEAARERHGGKLPARGRGHDRRSVRYRLALVVDHHLARPGDRRGGLSSTVHIRWRSWRSSSTSWRRSSSAMSSSTAVLYMHRCAAR
jgi:hypothetical protein